MASGIPLPQNDPTASTQTNPIIQKLLATLQQAQQASKQAGGALQAGSAPPTTAGVSPQASPPPPLPFQSSGARAPVSPAAPRGPSPPPPMPGGGTPTEFGSMKGAQQNTVQQTISNITQAIHQAVEKKKAKQTKEAENYTIQLNQALENGDKEMVDTMLSDPKIVKTIEKGLDYHFTKMQGGEPAPPEATGVKAAFQKIMGKQQPPQAALPKPGQPGGVMLPKPGPEQQLQNAVQNARLREAQDNPQFLRQLATGTSLSPEEQRTAELVAKNLQIAPADLAHLSALENQQILKTYGQMALEDMKAEAAMARTKVMASSREGAAAMGAESRINSAKIMADARKYAADMVHDAATKKGQGKVDHQLTLGVMKHYDNMSKTYATLAEKATSDDEKKFYQKQADTYQQKFDSLNQDIEDQKLMDQFQGVVSGADGAEYPGGSGGDESEEDEEDQN